MELRHHQSSLRHDGYDGAGAGTVRSLNAAAAFLATAHIVMACMGMAPVCFKKWRLCSI